MTTRRQMLLALIAAAVSLAPGGPSFGERMERMGPMSPPGPGQPASSGVTVNKILEQALPGPGNRQMTVLTVDFAPGGFSDPHRHPGPVFVYVLDGSVQSQVDPDQSAPETYSKGQTRYEPPMHIHKVARNASSTDSARILVYMISEPGKPITLPAGPMMPHD
jgi:quercetin dioxygenase-like cupin family protein